jgi:hypothetical protein
MRKRKIAGTVADPTLPKTPVVIAGKTYNLCLDFGALAEAETAINGERARAGNEGRVNLLVALAEQNLANTRAIFAAALRTFHPEIGFEEARKMVGPQNVFLVAMAIRNAWTQAMPEPETNPEEAQPQK